MSVPEIQFADMQLRSHPMASLGALIASNKVIRFALLGAVGCLLGASLGEVLLAITSFRGQRQAVCVLIDCSGSMHGEKLLEVKQAASQFVQQQDLSAEQITIVGFGSSVHTAARLGSDTAALSQAIVRLNDGGSTAMDRALDSASRELLPASDLAGDAQVTRNILLFTDGQPDDPISALEVANQCRGRKIRIIAIGTGDADVRYLAQITGDSTLVFPASSGNFSEGFEKADKAIHGSLVETSGAGGRIAGILRISAWTALLALGTALALIASQNHYLHRTALSPEEMPLGIVGGLSAGAIAGLAGQLLYLVLAGTHVPAIGQIVGWTILGALIGRGLAFFVPNLEPKKAALAGAAGGVCGAFVFLILSLFVPMLGRLVGAATLGAFIGAMIALVEAAFRQAWLEVRFGSKEMINVSLGITPVRIGSDRRACTIYARGVRPLACQYKLENEQVTFADFATEAQTIIQPGDQRNIGNVTVTLRASGVVSSKAAASSTRISPPPPPPPPKTTNAMAGSLPLSLPPKALVPPTPSSPNPLPSSNQAATPRPITTKTSSGLPSPPPPRVRTVKPADGTQPHTNRPNPPPKS